MNDEATLTTEQQQEWDYGVADWAAMPDDFPMRSLVLAVASRLSWLEDEKVRLEKQHRTTLAKLEIARTLLEPFQNDLAKMGIV